MHFYNFNIGDYRRRTAHLSPLEHGIYRMLLDTVYLEEKPLNKDLNKVMRTHCIRSANEMQAFRNVLSDFFFESKDGWENKHCNETIAAYHEKSKKAQASALVRWGSQRSNANASKTHSERNANGMLTKNQEPIKKTSANRFAHFDDFWSIYPVKRSKKKAKEIWGRKNLGNNHKMIIADVKNRLNKDRQWLEGFVPMPTTYMNGERWDDDVDTSPPKKSGFKKPEAATPQPPTEAQRKKSEEDVWRKLGYKSEAEYSREEFKKSMAKFKE